VQKLLSAYVLDLLLINIKVYYGRNTKQHIVNVHKVYLETLTLVYRNNISILVSVNCVN